MWLDSVGKRLNAEGKLLDDPNSTPATRISAFARMANHVLGKPIQPVLVENSLEGDILALFQQMSDEQLQAIIDEGERVAATFLAEQHVTATVQEQLEAPAKALSPQAPDPARSLPER